MERIRKRRRGLAAFVVGGLLLVALMLLRTATWATPEQDTEQGAVTVPPVKTVDNELVPVGGEAVFEVLLSNPQAGAHTWSDVVITDTIETRLSIRSLATTQGSIGVVGQDITVDVGDILPGGQATVTIGVAVEGGNPGDVIENRAYAIRPGYDPLGSTEATITIPYPVCLPLTMKGYSGP
jgi:uncharacterized repeat protein (TIGR01451 family)